MSRNIKEIFKIVLGECYWWLLFLGVFWWGGIHDCPFGL